MIATVERRGPGLGWQWTLMWKSGGFVLNYRERLITGTSLTRRGAEFAARRAARLHIKDPDSGFHTIDVP
jgi:hypothetical protein